MLPLLNEYISSVCIMKNFTFKAIYISPYNYLINILYNLIHKTKKPLKKRLSTQY
ncbi:hypothetical protein T190607A02C_20588 [Tenacibaculum sp. 190524A02b]